MPTAKRLPLSKNLAFAVQFSRFSDEFNIPASDLGQMIAHALKSMKAYERGDTKAEERHGDRIAEIAKFHGCKVDWPGLWPCIEREGEPRSNQLLPSP